MKGDIIIKAIEKESIAEELEIEPGDILLTINGEKPQDILEYTYLVNDEFLNIEIEKPSGEIWQIEIEKEFNERLGLVFQNEMLDKPKHCHNNCVFCFINQLPSGMRDSLYFKDDDSRLSFLHGNYVTMTNMSEEEIDRVIEYKLQPINISVHTTNPELRKKLLNNPKASNINSVLKKLYDNRITMNYQIVLVPGLNDGKELDSTLKDLMEYHPYAKSISVVPVGVTKYRDKLPKVRTFTDVECKNVVDQINRIQEIALGKYGKRVVYASDEFFLKGKLDVPNVDYYDGFPQLDNGVGMVSLFREECSKALKESKGHIIPKELTVITGMLAFDTMNSIINEVMDLFPQVDITLVPIKNEYFGSEITVSGLVTGNDIIEQLSSLRVENKVLFPSNMLRYEGDVFLDDLTVDKVSRELKVEIEPVEIDGKIFIEKLLY